MKLQPDEVFSRGPITYARYGNHIISQSNFSEEQFSQFQNRLANQFPEVVKEIDLLISNIRTRIQKLPFDRLLHRAWWEFARLAVGFYEKKSNDRDLSLSMRMIDYVQSVIASTEANFQQEEDVSEEDWLALVNDIQSLFKKLNYEFSFCQLSYEKLNDPNFDFKLAQFKHSAQLIWANVRGERYQVHEGQALKDVLLPHSDILQKLFDIDAETLIDELLKILDKLTKGLGPLFEEFIAVEKEFSTRIDEIARESRELDILVLRQVLSARYPELSARVDRLRAEIQHLDYFDLQKITKLPSKLLDELTWSPGEEEDFFASGDYAGWPLRLWPTMKRPFIRLNGQICCFDVFVLFDKIYRILQRVIFKLAPDYVATWNKRQKEVSESLPFKYLELLLPGAVTHRQIYYRFNAGKGGAQWHEADGVVIYDDHLFIIEVKAGAFTYTSPATDLSAHIESLKSLILSPGNQGHRFLSYLESSETVDLFDASHKRIASLNLSKFRHVSVCAITLDSFTELAARVQHLKHVGVDVGGKPVWALSIDDLRVYADLFKNPLQFLHYVEQRIQATQSQYVDLNDEMDHFGLYVEQNNYVMYADEFVQQGIRDLHFNGFRESLDNYYHTVTQGDFANPPAQEMPEKLKEIIEFLSKTDLPGRSEIASFLLDLSGEFRQNLMDAIQRELVFAEANGRTRPYTSYGGVLLTQFVHSPFAPRNYQKVLHFTQTVMVGNNETKRLALELDYTADRRLREVNWTFVTLDSLSAEEMSILVDSANHLKLKRLESAKNTTGKIGVNQPCPCGSGKKFKRCCK